MSLFYADPSHGLIKVHVTTPTTLLSEGGRIVGIAHPAGHIVVPAVSPTGTIEQVWDEFNAPIAAEVVWDGAKVSEGTSSVGLLPRM